METAGMINNVPGMLYRCINDPFSFTFVSKGSLELTGYVPEEFTGTAAISYRDIVHPQDLQNLVKLTASTLAAGLPLDTIFRIIAKDGTEKSVWLRSHVADTDDEGMPYVYEGYICDVTKLLRVETAEIANKAKTDFLAKISHDIRTPMNAILGMAELGLREDMPDKVRNYTLTIKEAGSNLMSILNAIMDFAKIESEELEIVPEEYTLSSVLNDVISITKEQIYETSLEFSVNVDERIPNMLIGDVVRLRQVLLNILSNAVKFTDEGYVSLSVKGEMQGGKLVLCIKIEDSGRGIKEEDIGNLFVAFTQFDTKTIEGIGLGMPITQQLVKLMGGEIEVSSMHGLGSIFTVRLPQQVRSMEEIGEQSLRPAGRSASFTAPDARVLIVDDISTNLRVAEGLLAPYEMQLDLCESGVAAIEAVKSQRYDLILMDHMMPVMNGIEATYCIRELGVSCKTAVAEVPIVALTANAAYGTREMFLQNGFDDFLPKPIEIVRLNDAIEKWIPKAKQVPIDAPSSAAMQSAHGFTIPNVDVTKGIKLTGGKPDVYLLILRTYYENGRRLIGELNDCVRKGDIELYNIHVHAIKSSSASIGADKISAAAEELERASNRGDLAFIEDMHPRFIGDYMAMLDGISPLLEKEVSKKDAPDKATVLELFDKLESLLAADRGEAHELVAELPNIPGADELCSFILDFEFEQALESLRKLRKEFK